MTIKKVPKKLELVTNSRHEKRVELSIERVILLHGVCLFRCFVGQLRNGLIGNFSPVSRSLSLAIKYRFSLLLFFASSLVLARLRS